jgi:apolipoprotein D and lipocalin family protein
VRARRWWPNALLAALLAGTAGCSAAAPAKIKPVQHVDMQRYMGRWYVIASIPTRFERNGYNPVETYRMQADGTVCTSFRFRPGSLDAPVKQIRSVATVVPGSGNGEWGVHLFGVLRFQYLVAWLAPDYSQVIVARDKRDHAWLMARTPTVPEADYAAMLRRLRDMGYDVSKVEKAPQRWPEVPAQPDTFEMRC